jgi:type IV secretory pathway VirB10-like protein
MNAVKTAAVVLNARVGYPAVLLLLLTMGCAPVKPDTPVSEPEIVATQPGTPQRATKPATPAMPPSEPAAAPAPSARPPGPQAATKVAPPVAKTAAALDLKTLEQELRSTKAIGFFTKLTLKNQVDDLLDKFREYHQGKATLTKTDLRRSYDLLMMKVLSLLQDEDQKLASAIVSSREAIWALLADPKTFATLQG